MQDVAVSHVARNRVLMSLVSVGPIAMEMKHFIRIIYDEKQTGVKSDISPLEKGKLVESTLTEWNKKDVGTDQFHYNKKN